MIKFFAHRGFAPKKEEENSITSLINAYQKGFRAIEFDIWFHSKKLLINHDEPLASEVKNLPQLSDYFRFKNEMEYWLDFKNLDESNIKPALLSIKDAIEEKSINLDKLYFVPFITDYQKSEKILAEIRNFFGKETRLGGVCENLESAKEIENLKKFLAKNNLKFLSISHLLIDENLVKILKSVELMAWTVNDLSRVKFLADLGVKSFATDTDEAILKADES